MTTTVDVIVVGGGPAGAAAAITAAGHGLSVILLERSTAPRARPGETLHAGVEPLFDQLGVGDAIRLADFRRFEGYHIETTAGVAYRPLGSDVDGPWLGYQVERNRLDDMLLARARHCGVDVRQGVSAQKLLVARHGRLAGVVAKDETIRADWVIDASGNAAWLKRRLGIGSQYCSPRLLAWYGYVEGFPVACDGNPRLKIGPDGWTWVAPLAGERAAWVRLATGDASRPLTVPAQLSDCRTTGRIRGVDTSWRIQRCVAASGYFLVGDAAASLDPASSHGVLRALMTGIMAAHCTIRIRAREVSEPVALAAYGAWLRDAFEHEAATLFSLYTDMDFPTAGWSDPSVCTDWLHKQH